ncbi:alpha/beta hydrolase family protein [Hanstruepera marina]|uniref:alpha/beta hydrolase family protein n=1 Tax=Hanstruepera marina TaxID=2873265 RepID=UPI001CA66CD9|nr:alpha/beta hydrolase [Hanstruepera marina]
MIRKNEILSREEGKPIVWDAFFNKNSQKKPLVVFCHGYKGFKDWGAWNLVAEEFVKANVIFVKFNFSHNGGTVDNPIDFPDLDAFAENNYSKELEDLDAMLNHLLAANNPFRNEIDTRNITVIGHSRGGGIAIIKASEDNRITKLITWASICDFGKRTATIGDLEQWKKDGVKYVLNGRTKQQMPHHYQFYEDYMANKERLNIKKAIKNLTIPALIIHGTDDPSVFFSEAENLHAWNTATELFSMANANHVFNSKHPWKENKLPDALRQVVYKSIDFIK